MCINTSRSRCCGMGAILLVLFLALGYAFGETADDQYLRIYGIIEQADALQAKGQTNQALAKYREAQVSLRSFEDGNRAWNPKLVAYRYKYLAQQIESLSASAAAPAEAAAPAAQPATQPQARPGPAAFKEQTRVIEAGAEPRRELRLHPNPGDKQAASMALKTTVNTAMGDMPSQTIKAPTITMSYEATVKSVSKAGDITYEVAIKEAGITNEAGALAQAVEPLKAALSGMQGLTGSGTVSSCGQSKGFSFKLPAGAGATTRALVEQMKDAFVNLTASLPKEPLGAGARWEVTKKLKQQGATINQTSTYELASAEGEHLVIKSTVEQSAADQRVEVPTMPGMKLRLKKFVGKGSISTTCDLGQLLPTERLTALHTEQYLDMNAGGQPQSLVSKTDMDLREQAK